MRMTKITRATVHISARNPWTGVVFKDAAEVREFHMAPPYDSKIHVVNNWEISPWIAWVPVSNISHAVELQRFGRGWSDNGYHYVIKADGTIELGRPESVTGAHVKGENLGNLGVCLLATDGVFTMAQTNSLVYLLKSLALRHQFSFDMVFGHNQFTMAKTCPQFDVKELRSLLRGHS